MNLISSGRRVKEQPKNTLSQQNKSFFFWTEKVALGVEMLLIFLVEKEKKRKEKQNIKVNSLQLQSKTSEKCHPLLILIRLQKMHHRRRRRRIQKISSEVPFFCFYFDYYLLFMTKKVQSTVESFKILIQGDAQVK